LFTARSSRPGSARGRRRRLAYGAWNSTARYRSRAIGKTRSSPPCRSEGSPAMYEAFYGFTGKPFQLNPDPQFYFDSRQHRRAMSFVEYGLHQGEGFIVITGEVGAGKTTMVRNILAKLVSRQVVAASLVSTPLTAVVTLRVVAAALGIRTKDLAKAEL